MSYVYHNFRNLYPDKYGRGNAHSNWQISQDLFNRAQNENIRYQKDMLKYGFGDPDAKREMQMTLQQYSPTELEANKYQMYGNQSWQNAIANEQAAYMDRQADWYENQMASKNHSDMLAFRAMMERTAAQERMNAKNADALSSMTTSLTAPSFGNGNTPGTSLYDNNNKKVGGSTPFYNSNRYYG